MSQLTAWDRISIARSQNRPKSKDLLPKLFDEIIELSGDRCYGDDAALIGAIARFEGMPVTILAQSKGRDLQENLACNFGMMNPEGYRKAMRLAKQAEKFRRPIITIIDTAGAYPGKGAEERGQAEAIASSLKMFATLQTPVIAIVLSEGGSGGALALSVADRIYMMENAVYSILSCEGFASILWKDETRAKEAAELMECTAMDLAKKGIIDGIIMEPQGGFDHQSDEVFGQIRSMIRRELATLTKIRVKNLVQQRYEKFRAMGNV